MKVPQSLLALLPLLLAVPCGLLLLSSCDDGPLGKELDEGPQGNLEVLQEQDEGVEVEDTEDDVPDTTPPPKDQCDLLWAFERPEGGVPRHPIVDTAKISTIAAGDTLRRVSPSGGESDTCDEPYRLKTPGEKLGSPTQTVKGTFFVGTTHGRVVAINKKCATRWELDLAKSVCEKHGKGCESPAPIRQAPSLAGEKDLFILDDRPALHHVEDLATGPNHAWTHFVSDERRDQAAPVYIGGDDPFVAFPTHRTVVAVQTTGSGRWIFDVFKEDEASVREVTSTLAVTKDSKLLFVGGDLAGETYTNNKLYRLLPTSPDKSARVDEGWPVDLDLNLDTVAALVVGTNESIYAATLAHGVIKLDPDGKELWRFVGDEESLRVTAVPAIGDDGALYFTSEPHFFYAVDFDGNRIFRYQAPSGGELASTSPAIRNDGAILVHIGTQLRAYQCKSGGLAVSSWPRYQRNNRNGGNVSESN